MDYKQSVYSLFKDLGFPEFRDQLRCQCPIHGGDNSTAFSFNFEFGWQCWTNRCHEDYPKGLIGLIMATQKCEHEEAKEILQKYIDNANLELSKGTFKSYERKENKVFDQSLIPTKGNSSYFQNRGFKKETIEHFQCFDCLNQKKNLYNRAVVPIFDDESRLVAFTGRSIENSYIKWLHQPKSFYKSGVLYNLNNAKYYISRLGTVILTEGPLDVWKLHEAGIYNSVALLGTTISNEQINLLKKYSTKKTILMVDPDRAGLKSMLKKNGLFDKLISHFSVYSLRHLLENDIGETNIEYINSTIKPELRKIIYDK